MNSKTCVMCTPDETGACNTFEFPYNRRKCIQCATDCDMDCPNHNRKNTINKYSGYCSSIADSCVVIKESDVQRQVCRKDLTQSQEDYCNENGDHCKICEEDDCNWDDQMDDSTETPTTPPQG